MGRVSYSSVSGIVWRKGALYSIYIGSNKTMMKGSKRYDSKITVFLFLQYPIAIVHVLEWLQ